MDFLSLTLKLGSFLIILPYLSGVESTTATISMPQYSTQNSEIKVKCEFTATQLLKMLLHYGNSKAEAYYSIPDGKYVIDPTPELTLEIGPGTSSTGGSFTFVFSRIACDKFTIYQCKAVDKNDIQSSSNRTLQALPSVESIRQTSGSIPTVNELSSFRCRGTVRKEGTFSVEWYRNTITLSNRLQAPNAQVTGNNQCGRMVSSTLRYNISHYDAPNLVLWCRIVAQQNVDKSANFTIKATATISMPQYATQNSEIKVKCEFTASELLKMVLHYGNSKAEAYYSFNDVKYIIGPTPDVTLEIGPGISPQGGSLTFVFSQIACDKFTTYQCEAVSTNGKESSSNRTLQALPSVESIRQTSGSIPTVNEVSSFTCRGTVRKEDPFSVEWYRNTITLSNRLQAPEAQVTGNNQCGHIVSSILRYKISQYDAPNLVLWCRIVAQQNVDNIAIFTIQEISTIAAPVKDGPDVLSIIGIVLGIINTILIVLLICFLVRRTKQRAEPASKMQGPEPHFKDSQVDENRYTTVHEYEN